MTKINAILVACARITGSCVPLPWPAEVQMCTSSGFHLQLRTDGRRIKYIRQHDMIIGVIAGRWNFCNYGLKCNSATEVPKWTAVGWNWFNRVHTTLCSNSWFKPEHFEYQEWACRKVSAKFYTFAYFTNTTKTFHPSLKWWATVSAAFSQVWSPFNDVFSALASVCPLCLFV